MTLEPDDFHFVDPMGDTEDISRYTPGGYHPLRVGDIIKSSRIDDISGAAPQYRIMHKLGFGSYATVWLAQKTDSSKFVAVKVTTDDAALTNEAAILEAVSKVRTTEESHVLTLLDHFTIHGPNGKHLVLVTDVVAPILKVRFPKRDPLWYKTAALGLVKGVAHLHATGIVHGDLHLGNVGVAFPQLAHEDPDDVMQDLSPYDLTIVLPSSAINQTPSLPPYVVAPCNLSAYYNKLANSDLPKTKLIDFGSAHEAGKSPLHFQCAVEACAPEVVFSRVVEDVDNPPMEPPTDIWALGAAIYEIVTGSSLFRGIGMTGVLPEMIVMAGTLPHAWEEWHKGLANPPTVSPTRADSWWRQRRETLRQNCADDADADALIALLRKLLVLDPTARPTAEQITQDEWFLQTGKPTKEAQISFNTQVRFGSSPSPVISASLVHAVKA
ncbi:kinase-like protein [Pluteus cervinus]|uniref:Kinase-like protein n=1 Tax=Pluteus cervinus TaxID=181527 RepID=A0ACD3AR76_9AGAR|nr:kinase-like protein [Pluteus cervinus]